MLFVDSALSPVHVRNLSQDIGVPVVDRVKVILDIFSQRAKSKEAKMQVELARLQHRKSSLAQSHSGGYDQQRGGGMFLGGGGEKEIELKRREIDDRIAKLRRELTAVTRTFTLHREARARSGAVVALCGYTNSGKTTLASRLSSDPKAFSPEDMLFATLDSKVRSLTLPSGSSCFVVDTVGFISDLPTDLVAAFRATLSELTHCDVLLHVRDASNPTAETQGDAVLDVLRSIGVPHGTLQHRIDVWNKADLLSDEQLEGLDSMVSDQVSSCRVSAETGSGLAELVELITQRVLTLGGRRLYSVSLAAHETAAVRWLYQHGVVREVTADDQGGTDENTTDMLHIEAWLSEHHACEFQDEFLTSLEEVIVDPKAHTASHSQVDVVGGSLMVS